jgi:hypothetical protein
MSGGAVVQYDLFDNTPEKVARREQEAEKRRQVEEDHSARVALFRQHREHDDWRNPGSGQLTYTLPWKPADGVELREGVRCGRCAEVVAPYDLVINHDTGWCGCPTGSPGRPQLTAEQMCERADNELAPTCVACGHAWGVHDHVIVAGGFLPAQMGCVVCYRCDGYTPPPMAATPWGTCPGCWGEPHNGPCPDPRRTR